MGISERPGRVVLLALLLECAWRGEIREIVSIAVQAGGPARDAAAALVRILAARGHLDCMDLLPGSA